MPRIIHIRTILLTICLVAIAAIMPAKAQIIDGSVAIVGTRMILLSDIEMELVRMRMQGEPVAEAKPCKVLENLLIHNLLLDQADLDSIPINLTEASQEVDQRINYFIQQLGNEKELERQYGRPLREIKSTLRQSVAEQRQAQQVRNTIISNIQVTPSQVRDYYRHTPLDSLPLVPEQFVYRQLTLNPVSSTDAVYAVKERLLNLRERILQGERFATLAMAYSEDRASAMKGGEMGYLPKESFVKPFADAAFSLQDGQVSQIVETEYGYHIIQMIGRKGNTANVRHILLKPSYSPTEMQATIARMDSIRTLIVSDSTSFDKACGRFSDDKDTRFNGGLAVNPFKHGTAFEKEMMLPVDYYAVRDLAPGQISAPFESRDKNGNTIIKIIQLVRRTDAHKMNLDEDYAELQDLAKKEQEKKRLENWLEKKSQQVYIRIDPQYKDCNFELPFWKAAAASK